MEILLLKKNRRSLTGELNRRSAWRLIENYPNCLQSLEMHCTSCKTAACGVVASSLQFVFTSFWIFCLILDNFFFLPFLSLVFIYHHSALIWGHISLSQICSCLEMRWLCVSVSLQTQKYLIDGETEWQCQTLTAGVNAHALQWRKNKKDLQEQLHASKN